uniref:Uncharacterized protein n=2 Tax=Helicotheca tamesis TaxID=374047 RepID=A0A7S2MVR4_9STRA
MKAELLERRRESARSRPVSLSPGRVPVSDKVTFAEVSFDGDQSDVGSNIPIPSDVDSEGSWCGVAAVDPFRTPTKRKRRVVKVPHSPKKWRRMVRDNRLQSIYLGQ